MGNDIFIDTTSGTIRIKEANPGWSLVDWANKRIHELESNLTSGYRPFTQEFGELKFSFPPGNSRYFAALVQVLHEILSGLDNIKVKFSTRVNEHGRFSLVLEGFKI